MMEFALALAAFLIAHAVPAMPGLRARLVAGMGRGPYLIAYSALSLGLLAWLIVATQRADTVLLWEPRAWQWHWAFGLMPFAVFFLVAGLMSANPLSISFRAGDRPDAIVAITRHPVLWGFLLWALAHIPPNGDLVSVILFGGMAAFSLAGFAILDAKARRRLGPELWRRMAKGTSIVPLGAILSGRATVRRQGSLLLAAILAVTLYAWLLLQGHALLIGPDPLAALPALT